MTTVEKNSQKEKTDHAELLNGIHYTGDKGPWFGARHFMIILMAVGFSISLATKTVFSIVLVAMTTKNTSSNADIPTYDWNNKGVILSSGIWLGIPIQLISGHWGKRYGHKWLIMGATLVNAAFFMLIPLFAKLMGSTGIIICRIIEGGAHGILYPVGVGMNGLWVPAEERSKLGIITVTIMYMNSMIAFVGSGLMVETSWGYPWCYYIVGIFNVLWCIGWYFLGHENPSTHPRITPEERKYIETSLNTHNAKDIPTPWLRLLTSIHFWAPVVAAIGTCWVDTMMSSVNVIYFTKAWNLDLAKSSYTIGLLPVIGLIVGVLLGPVSDYLIQRKYLRVINARRIFHTVSNIGTSVCFLWMTWIPAGSMVWIVMNLCIGNVFSIACSITGANLNIPDIAPAFAGIIGGFANTFSQCFALVAPMTIDWILEDEGNRDQWRIIFYITIAILMATTIFFDIFATDKRIGENTDEENNNKK